MPDVYPTKINIGGEELIDLLYPSKIDLINLKGCAYSDLKKALSQRIKNYEDRSLSRIFTANEDEGELIRIKDDNISLLDLVGDLISTIRVTKLHKNE